MRFGTWISAAIMTSLATGQGNNIALSGGRGPQILQVKLYRYR